MENGKKEMEAMEVPVPEANHRTGFFFSTKHDFGNSKYTPK